MKSVHVLAAEPNVGGWIVGGLLIAVVLGFLVLFVAALVSILGARMAGGMKVVWVVFAFCAPFLGSALWFLVGRHHTGEAARG